MADWTLKLESSEAIKNYNVEVQQFENMASESRLISSEAILGFRCKSPALNQAQLKQYLDFFDLKKGSLTAFTFTWRADGQTYIVLFTKDGIKVIDVNGYFQAEFSFERVF
jgi:hypothetical protein